MAQMLMGAFRDKAQADRALAELEDRGYSPEEISVISQSKDYVNRGYDDTAASMAKGAGSGAVTGGVVGGLAGLLAGAGVFPALAGLFIGGPIAAALGLAGAAATTFSGAGTGAVVGGLIGALTGLGLSKETAKSYDETIREGGVVLGVTGREATDEARDIMERCGAEDCNVIDMKDEVAETRDAESARPMKREPAFGESREAFGEQRYSEGYSERLDRRPDNTDAFQGERPSPEERTKDADKLD